jgi:hypothetical protein
VEPEAVLGRRAKVAAILLVLVFLVAWPLAVRLTALDAGPLVTVDSGEAWQAGGAEWKLERIYVLDDSGFDDSERPVAGAVFVVAEVSFAGDSVDVSCTVELLGEDRQWTQSYVPSAVLGDDVVSSCADSPGGTVAVAFQIPASAVGEVRGVELSVGGDYSTIYDDIFQLVSAHPEEAVLRGGVS